jgi:hypothetical protein
MRSETTILKMKLQDSLKATKNWMLKAQKLEADISELQAQLNRTKSQNRQGQTYAK